MGRLFVIYIAALTFAEFALANGTSVNYTARPVASESMGEVTYADMKPVAADGKNVAPIITDFTKEARDETAAAIAAPPTKKTLSSL